MSARRRLEPRRRSASRLPSVVRVGRDRSRRGARSSASPSRSTPRRDPAFYARYRALQAQLRDAPDSAHKGLTCNQCHGGTSGPVGYAARVGDFYRSLVKSARAAGVRVAVDADVGGVPQVPHVPVERQRQAHQEDPASGAPARGRRDARVREVPQVDRARRGVHAEAQVDAVLDRVRVVRLPRGLEDDRRSAGAAITRCRRARATGSRSTASRSRPSARTAASRPATTPSSAASATRPASALCSSRAGSPA